MILGAGASAASDFRLPTMKGFFGPDIDGWAPLHAFLKRFYRRAKDPSEYNLEEVLAYLDLARRRLGLWREPPDSGSSSAAFLYSLLVPYIINRLSITEGQACSTHKR